MDVLGVFEFLHLYLQGLGDGEGVDVQALEGDFVLGPEGGD